MSELRSVDIGNQAKLRSSLVRLFSKRPAQSRMRSSIGADSFMLRRLRRVQKRVQAKDRKRKPMIPRLVADRDPLRRWKARAIYFMPSLAIRITSERGIR